MRLLGLLFYVAFAATKTVPLPAIVTARKQILEGDRSAAIMTLSTAIADEKAENKNSPKVTELQNELTQLTQVFLTNDAQRAFELAESTRHSGKPGFLTQYEQATKKEPQNTRVLAGYILGLIAAKTCAKAIQVANQIEEIDSNMPELKYLKFRAQLCADPTQLTAKRDSEIDSDKSLTLYHKNARANEQFVIGKPEAALVWARETMQADDKFPQGYYWAFKVLSKENLGLDEAQRFLSLCKGSLAQTRRAYTYEPDVCAQTDEVEDYMRDEEAGKHEAKQ